MAKVLVTKHCRTVEGLLARLSPQHEYWQPDPRAWIFRGQADARWKLLASAHRNGVDEIYRPWGLPPTETLPRDQLWFSRRAAENQLLETFREAVDEAGMNVPADTSELSDPDAVSFVGDVPRYKLPLLALAQHVGLPTSLLDWTRIAAKAAYFAAADRRVDEGPSQPDTLAIWAVRKFAVDARGLSDLARMDIVNAPLWTNPNLHAQSGLFTRATGSDVPPVEEYVAKRYKNRTVDLPAGIPISMIPPPLPWMRKLTLPRTHTQQLLRLLSNAGINGSSMFPGQEGVVKRLKEEAYWKADVSR
jgi:hypothetical protein